MFGVICPEVMKAEQVKLSRHAITRMFEQKLSIEIVKQIALGGEIIKSYDDDKPFPSYLCLGFENGKPIHVVAAINQQEKTCVIITAYIPDSSLWSSDYKTKIRKK